MSGTVSIIIPAINEEKGIGKTISAIPFKKLKDMGYNTEILVIDGGSRDNTVVVAKKNGARVIVELRRGYGLALRRGFDAAKGDVLISVDADYTYPIEDLPKLLDIMLENNLDFMNTNRLEMLAKNAMSTMNRFGNAVLSIVARLLFGIPFRDSQSGMWLMKKDVWGKIRNKVRSNGMSFSQEIKIEAFRAGFRCSEVPISYRGREGKAKLEPWKDGIGNLMHLFKKKCERYTAYSRDNSVGTYTAEH
ncbi:MAG: glycosyltransferase family 2 protein [Candidatus Bilamarchaeaceae archaeon]